MFGTSKDFLGIVLIWHLFFFTSRTKGQKENGKIFANCFLLTWVAKFINEFFIFM